MIIPVFFMTLLLAQVPDKTAQQQFETGNYKSALSTLKTALASSPKNAAIHFGIGRCQYELSRYDESIKEFEEAVRLNGKSSEYHLWLGHAYGAEADASNSFFLARKVKQALETAVRLDPNNFPARRDLVQFLTEAPWVVGGDTGRAKKEVAAIAAIDPLQGRLARAVFLNSDKQYKEAAAEYRSIVDSKPGEIEAYLQAADFFTDRRDAAGIEKAVAGASRIKSDDPRLGFYRGVALVLGKGDPVEAERLLKGYMKSVPDMSIYPSHKSAKEWIARIGK